MKNNTSLKVFCLFILALFTQVAVGDDGTGYFVANIWEPGNYTLRQDCFISLITSVQKEEKGLDQTRATFTWQAKVDEIQENGVQKMEMQAKRITLRFQGEGAAYAFFDSSNKSLNTSFENEVFEAFMNTTVVVSFKNGEVFDVKTPEDVWKDFSPKDDAEAFFMAHFQELPTLKMFKQIFDPFNWVANPVEVKVNDEWKNEIQVPIDNVGDRDLTWNCKLKAVQKRGSSVLAVVGAKSELSIEASKLVTANMKAEMDVKYDVKIGMPIELISKSTVTAIKKSEKDGEPDVTIVAMQKNNLTVAKR